MAKMIKCPTCGTQIEVPPQASGQIVKCPGCGKGLKLVAKPKPGGGAPGGGQQAGAGSGVSGSSVSAMTFVGEPPPMERPAAPAFDDLPSLDSNCAVCGRAVDPEDLVEDNGRLVCMDCVKGARSGMARPDGGAEVIEFKQPMPSVRRGKLINFTPMFFIGAIAAMVLIGAQIYLTLFEKPIGTRTASANTVANGGRGTPAPAVPFDPDTNPAPTATSPAAPGDATASTTPAPADSTAAVTPAPGTPTDSTNPNSTTAAAPADSTAVTPTTTNAAVALAPVSPEASTIFTDGPGPKDSAAAPGAGDPGAVGAPADVPAPAPSVVSSDPLSRGMERLVARDYGKAITDLDGARLKYVINKLGPGGAPLTPQQQLTLEGLAAAYIGQNRFDAARGPLESAYARNVRTRSLILNTAIYMMSAPKPAAALEKTAELVRQQLGAQPGDEYAADIFGTLVNKIASMDRTLDKATKDKIDGWWAFHDRYIDAMVARNAAAAAADAKLKWGIDWLPAEDVKIYRQSRGVVNPGAGVGAAAKQVEVAAQQVRSAENTLKSANAAKAEGKAADVQGAQAQVDAANAGLVTARKALNDANAAVVLKKPRWLTTFEPVIPQQVVAP